MAETRARPAQGIIDTSVVIDLEDLNTQDLPVEVAISSLTLAELAAGPHATDDPEERARRQDRLQRTEAAFDPLPFDAEAVSSARVEHSGNGDCRRGYGQHRPSRPRHPDECPHAEPCGCRKCK